MANIKWTSSLQSRALGVAGLALVGLIGYFVAKTVIIFLSPESAWVAPKFAVNTTASRAVSGPANYDFSFDPFHRDITVVPADIGGDAPETTLNLKLKGRRAAEDGTAILLTPDNKQAVYKIGDEIISNVILKAVTPEYIVLSQNGRLERLTYEKNEPSVLRAAAANPIAGQTLSLETLLSAVTIAPEVQGGKVLGYKITPKTSNLDLSAVKLQSGDVITRIGNIDLTKGTPDLGLLMNKLKNSKSASITLIRGGQMMTVKVG